MVALIERGELYLNTLEYFRRGEDGLVRFDSDEGLRRIYQGPDVNFTISALGRTLLESRGGDKIDALRLWLPGRTDINVFCMTAVTELGPFAYDERFRGFGDTCMIVTNPREFIRRLGAGVRTVGRSVQSELVQYVPTGAHVGDMGVFRKFDSFAWQSEIRMAVDPFVVTGGPLKFSVGSLTDIARLAPVETLARTKFSMAAP